MMWVSFLEFPLLAIFFWIMPGLQHTSRGSIASAETCYFLLNYAECVRKVGWFEFRFMTHSCYFLLNYAGIVYAEQLAPEQALELAIFFWIMPLSGSPLRLLPGLMSCYFLLNYAGNSFGWEGGDGGLSRDLAIFFWIMHAIVLGVFVSLLCSKSSLLFSFELCLLYSGITSSNCLNIFLLFSFELCPALLTTTTLPPIATYLAIFFWIMRPYSTALTRRQGASYLLFSFELCEEEAVLPRAGWQVCLLAIFFWIMLGLDRCCHHLHSLCLAIFFWIMPKIHAGARQNQGRHSSLLFSFELCPEKAIEIEQGVFFDLLFSFELCSGQQ